MSNYVKTVALAFAAAFAVGFMSGAQAAPAPKKNAKSAVVARKNAQKGAPKRVAPAARKSKAAAARPVGEGLKRKKSHSFDGMTLEGLNNGRYDSITSLSEGGDRGESRLYTLPANFSYRAADEKSEMRYRP